MKDQQNEDNGDNNMEQVEFVLLPEGTEDIPPPVADKKKKAAPKLKAKSKKGKSPSPEPVAEEVIPDLPPVLEHILPVIDGKCEFPKIRMCHKSPTGYYYLKIEDQIAMEQLKINPIEIKIEYFDEKELAVLQKERDKKKKELEKQMKAAAAAAKKKSKK